jgi:hypothetical protein
LHLILTSIFSSISEDLNRFALGAFEMEQVYFKQITSEPRCNTHSA